MTPCCSSVVVPRVTHGVTLRVLVLTVLLLKHLLRHVTKVVHIEKEARDILTEAARTSPELAIAMETWKEIKFEFETVDKLDVN